MPYAVCNNMSVYDKEEYPRTNTASGAGEWICRTKALRALTRLIAQAHIGKAKYTDDPGIDNGNTVIRTLPFHFRLFVMPPFSHTLVAILRLYP